MSGSDVYRRYCINFVLDQKRIQFGFKCLPDHVVHALCNTSIVINNDDCCQNGGCHDYGVSKD